MPASTSYRFSPFWTAQVLGWGTYALAKSVLSPTAYPDAWRVILLVGLGLFLSLPLRSLYRRLRAAPSKETNAAPAKAPSAMKEPKRPQQHQRALFGAVQLAHPEPGEALRLPTVTLELMGQSSRAIDRARQSVTGAQHQNGGRIGEDSRCNEDGEDGQWRPR